MAVSAFVCLVGYGRSGSTLVHELLARHPDVGFVSNIEDRLPLPPTAGRYNNLLYRSVPPALTHKGRPRYAPSEAYRALTREVSPMIAESCRDLLAEDAMPWVADRLRSFFLRRARAQDKPAFLHKFTGWPRAGFIQAVLPDTRFIHIVRDPRAVVASDLQASWWRGYLGPEQLHITPLPPAYAAEWEASGRSFAVLSALAWKLMLDAHAAARERIPASQWLDVRFEDVLADPSSRFKEMLEFMGLEDSKIFRRALSRTAFRRDRVDAFRRQLDPGTLAAIEKCLADHQRRWGYLAGE
jgi:hypothetical protein